MNQERIAEAAEVIGWLAEQAANSTHSTDRVTMALHLQLARVYLVEYLSHLQGDSDPLDALDATARGELALADSKADLLRALGFFTK